MERESIRPGTARQNRLKALRRNRSSLLMAATARKGQMEGERKRR